MTSAAAASYQSAAEVGDPEDSTPFSAEYLRCRHCGAFLRVQADNYGFDREHDTYWERRTCKRCGKETHEWVL